MTTTIIARHNEDAFWIAEVEKAGLNPRVYDKGEPCGIPWSFVLANIGREPNTYFKHIVDNYNVLDGDIIFCQGNPFDHDPKFLEHIKDPEVKTYGAILGCDPHGRPQCDWTDLHSFSRVMGLPFLDHYKFVQGSQFRVSAKQITARSKDFYRACLALTKIEANKSPWVFERLFDIIFGMNL